MRGWRGGVLVLCAALLHCGPRAPIGPGASDGSTAATGSTSASSGTSGVTETTGGAATGATSTAPTGSSTGAVGSTDVGSTGGSSGSTGGPPEEPYYVAYMYVGGLDRLIVRKIDPAAGRCTSISIALAGPSTPPEVEIVTPPEWSIERITVEPDLQDCDTSSLPPPEIQSTTAVGTVSWTGDFWPELVDIDVALTFDQDPPWEPAEELLSAVELAVEG